MRAILQRVSEASVTINGEITRNTGAGLLILLGVTQSDTEEVAKWLARKCCELRIFSDEQDKMNLSLMDVDGEAMIVSNFTLYADCKKGRRPAYVRARGQRPGWPGRRRYPWFLGPGPQTLHRWRR